ncbi:MAG: hypothetical protein C0400_22760, partial [Ralstonia sp.]|nr:hypothetical protein [Ralstonia sp.]MBA4404642.1 hypothetical protein [Ralstonia sp.]
KGSPSRARLSLLTFFGKTKKVSHPRQGVKREWTTKAQTTNHEPPTHPNQGDPSPWQPQL